MSSAQPKGELHFDVHFVGKWGQRGQMTCPGTHRGELKIHLLQLCLAPGSEFSRLGKETSSDQKSKKESALTGQSGVGEEILLGRPRIQVFGRIF